ncbi:Sensor protein FixL [Rosistilla carotiformis]|uniref:histidine kinase n=1 Tax=Rosistilla carotiformis TaxID=2528017 RepID=A0A518JRJ3_9BACT|nr:PAS domain S-box protein [Rosistilla carotiformis]QDV68147.1 Sensor protein FixL [Rosistilla carotiformis]
MNRRLSHLLFLTLTLLAIMGLYLRSIDRVSGDYARLATATRVTMQHNVDLDSAVLSLRLGIRQDYDQLTYYEQSLHSTVSNGLGKLAAPRLLTPELHRRIDNVESLVQDKLVLSHEFKATHAIVRNSIAALLRNVELAKQSPTLPANLKLVLADLESSGYRFSVSGKSTDRKVFSDTLAKLKSEWMATNGDAPYPKIDWTIRHGTKLIELRHALDETVSRLVAIPVRPATLAVMDDAIKIYQRQWSTQNRYHAGMIVAIMVLLGYCATQAMALWKNAHELNVINKALEQRGDDQTADLQRSKDFFQGVLDAIDAPICVLDSTGRIVETNASWGEFSQNQNSHRLGIGSNYLQECRRRVQDGQDDGAKQFADAIEAVIAGHDGQHVSEYECESPTDKFWYQVNVTPLRDHQAGVAVVTHLDITDRVAAQRKLLETSEHLELLSLVAKYTDNSVVITDAHGCIEWVNDGFRRVSGYSFEDVKGKVPGNILYGEKTDPSAIAQIQERILKKQGFDAEILHYRKSGEPYWVAIGARPIHNENGALVRYVAVDSEITDRKESEARLTAVTQTLQTQKQTLDAVLESVAAGIVSVNHQGDIVSFNPAAEEIFGEHWLKSESLLEQLEAVEIVDPITYDPIPLIQLPMIRALQGEQVRNEELLVRRKDKDVLVSINAIPLASDGQQGAVITVLDITQQWKRDLNQRMLREGLDFAQDAMFVCESVGRIIDANEVSCKRLGYAREDLLKLVVSDIDPGVPAEKWPDFWSQLKQRKAMVLESKHRKIDGSTFPVEVTINYSDFGGIQYACCFARDITARKLAERERDQLAGELQNAARQAGMAEVATGVLHNVGNVLNSVNVSTNLIRDRIQASPVEHLSKAANVIAENEADLGNFLTNDKRGKHFPALLKQLATSFQNERDAQNEEIQALAKSVEHIKEIVSMQQSFARKSGMTESVDPIEMFEDAIKINDASLVRHGVDLVREFDAVPNIQVRRHEVLQILINLIKNAKQAVDKADASEKVIRLTARTEGEHVRLEVQDNGIGISAENLKNIFQHGFTTKTTGHGFGLHSCANSAREMGGCMSVHSDGEGRGATFTLKLPLQDRKETSGVGYFESTFARTPVSILQTSEITALPLPGIP